MRHANTQSGILYTRQHQHLQASGAHSAHMRSIVMNTVICIRVLEPLYHPLQRVTGVANRLRR